MTKQKEVSSHCTRGGLGYILEKISSLKKYSDIETGCPSKRSGIIIPGSVQKMSGFCVWGHGLVVSTVLLG